jgi:chromatin segregation and condensation protein Rec8/ScpA/Scc1 (kleisin family)
MEDKIALILDALRDVARVEFSRLLKGLEGIQGKTHGVMTFLASLELTRRRDLFLRQARPFGELWLYRRDEEGDEGGDAATATAPAGAEGLDGAAAGSPDAEAPL